jgi:hypothetical protein
MLGKLNNLREQAAAYLQAAEATEDKQEAARLLLFAAESPAGSLTCALVSLKMALTSAPGWARRELKARVSALQGTRMGIVIVSAQERNAISVGGKLGA